MDPIRLRSPLTGATARTLLAFGALWCVLSCLPLAAQSAESAESAAPIQSAEPAQPAAEGPGPRLAVLLVVDQLPAGLLEEYDSLFTGGLRMLLDRGVRFTRSSHAYLQTHTAAGHATLATGSVPARHGIVGNAWREKGPRAWDAVLAVVDTLERIPTLTWAEGRSPAHLRREGLADWLLAARPEATVVAVGAKDRSAILLAGRARAQVYWINSYAKRFVTSSYYRPRLPDWVRDFNEDRLPAFLSDSVWASTVPAGRAALSRADTTEFEGDGVHTHFPHRYLDEADLEEDGAHAFWVAGTPAPDAATLAFALEAVDQLALGTDTVSDFLAVSLAQTDLVGHAYGPHSREQLDNLLRLDRELNGFLEGLDRAAGPDGWVMAFTSDHGTLPMPEHLQARGVDSRRTSLAELQDMIVAARVAQQGPQPTAPGAGAVFPRPEVDPAEAAERVADTLRTFPLARQVWTGAQLRDDPPADSFSVMAARSYVQDRAVGYFGEMDVLVRFPEFVLPTTRSRGTDHRTGYWYDRHVPLLFVVPGVDPRVETGAVRAVDVAPTLFRLLGLEPPDDLDGRPILSTGDPGSGR